MVVLFFFFKQKTAYEMRISDWSSDVCSSDLALPQLGVQALGEGGDETVGLCRAQGGPDVGVGDVGAEGHVAADGVVEEERGLGYDGHRSEERRVGKERVRWGRSRWSPVN